MKKKRKIREEVIGFQPIMNSPQWRSRTFGRPGRWSNLPPFRLRYL